MSDLTSEPSSSSQLTGKPVDIPAGTEVTISVPADVSFVSTLRLTTASLAARCGLTVDDIEDLRLAVDEACALLLPHAEPATALDIRFLLSKGEIEVDAAIAATNGAEPDRSGFAWTVLGALANDVTVQRDGGRLTITVVKHTEAST